MGRARLEKACANQHIPFKQALAQFPPKTSGFHCSLQRVEFCLTPGLTRSTPLLWKSFMYVSLFTSLFKVITIAFQILPEDEGLVSLSYSPCTPFTSFYLFMKSGCDNPELRTEAQRKCHWQKIEMLGTFGTADPNRPHVNAICCNLDPLGPTPGFNDAFIYFFTAQFQSDSGIVFGSLVQVSFTFPAYDL